MNPLSSLPFLYLKARHRALYRAIRSGYLWIPSRWKLTLALVLRQGDVFLDVGANIGVVTQAASWLVGKEGKVFSFEPSPSVASYLRNRVALLKLTNVTINQFALGSHEGTAILYEYELYHGGQSSLQPVTTNVPEVSRTEVPVRTLDDYARQVGLGPIRLIKIDVEGSEIDVLAGGKMVLNQHPRPILFVEVSRATNEAFGRSVETLLKTIADFGYQMFSWRAEGLIEVQHESDIPINQKTNDVICLDRKEHPSLYQRFASLAQKGNQN